MVTLSDLPTFTLVHVSIGIVGLSLGFLAFVLRIPTLLNDCWKLVEQFQYTKEDDTDNVAESKIRFIVRIEMCTRLWHTVCGSGFVICTLFMPITANWIWPRIGTPYVVIWFIGTLFIGLCLGFISIRIYSCLNEPTSHRGCCLKYLHCLFMLYAAVMLLGAAQAFLGNALSGGFPYDRDDPVTDSLVGRCYARNLNNPDAPAWLTSLECGLGVYCAQSSRGNTTNPFDV